MKKSIIYLAIGLSLIQTVSCKKEKKAPSPQTPVVPTNKSFQVSDIDSSLWILKGYYKNGAYVATYSNKCGCNQDYGFVLNYKQDTIPYNKGKYYTYYRDISTGADNQQGAYWMPVDSIFKGWPTGKSDFFQQYTIISANKDSLIIDDGTPNTSDGSYAVYTNESNLLK